MSASSNQVQSAIQAIADKYQCDPNDPLFSILEKIDEYHQDVKTGFQGTIPKEIETLQALIQSFELKTKALDEVALKLSSNVLKENMQVIGESTENLIWYWKHARWHHALSGLVVSLILCVGSFSWFYYKSADRLLSQAGVRLQSEVSDQGHKLTLSGHKLIRSGRSDHELVGEFQ